MSCGKEKVLNNKPLTLNVTHENIDLCKAMNINVLSNWISFIVVCHMLFMYHGKKEVHGRFV